MSKLLLGFTDNEWSMIQDALKFQMEYYFNDESMGLVIRTYALRLGELVDQIDRNIETKEEASA
jgi:hypothetical protein